MAIQRPLVPPIIPERCGPERAYDERRERPADRRRRRRDAVPEANVGVVRQVGVDHHRERREAERASVPAHRHQRDERAP